ncbi:hypothetical protein ACIQFZ_33605 [Streptomyces sp. NPDC093064]|uniref:hypothetical protein n=1 Tax=unclassified Streptomyces TaxID=2593676 RepID=UPI003436B177
MYKVVAGGVTLDSAANSKIAENVWVMPAAGDAGAAPRSGRKTQDTSGQEQEERP